MESTDKYIIIHPWARGMRNGKENPKNYPWWPELIALINNKYPDIKIVQIGVKEEKKLVDDFRTNLKFIELEPLIDGCITWMGIDSFFQHLGWYRKKKGIAIFAKQDPLIFGHKENINLLKSRKKLREKQMWLHEQTNHDPNDFLSPEEVFKSLETLLK